MHPLSLQGKMRTLLAVRQNGPAQLFGQDSNAPTDDQWSSDPVRSKSGRFPRSAGALAPKCSRGRLMLGNHVPSR